MQVWKVMIVNILYLRRCNSHNWHFLADVMVEKLLFGLKSEGYARVHPAVWAGMGGWAFSQQKWFEIHTF